MNRAPWKTLVEIQNAAFIRLMRSRLAAGRDPA